MFDVKVLYDMDNGEVNYDNPSPESGYYASSPDSAMTMSPEYTGNFQSYEMNLNNYIPGVCLVATKVPQVFFRFRYESEMHGTHGSLMGIDSSKEIKTYPTVKLMGVHLLGQNNPKIRIRCTLYQADRRNELPHSHKLVIKNGDQEKYDPHFMDASVHNDYEVEFKGMGIIHTAKKDIVKELGKKLIRLKEFELERELTPLEKERELNKVRSVNAKTMNLNQLCLCFEAFCFDHFQNKWVQICPAIFSDPINNIKSALTGELKICNYNTCVSSVTGGQEVYLLVEKVNRGDIKVLFTDDSGWQEFGQIDVVHHQFAIVLRTPPYKSQTITKPVQVWMQLYRTKDGTTSEKREFTYKPIDATYSGGQKRKLRRVEPEIPTVVEAVVSSTTSGEDDLENIDLELINFDIPLSPEENKLVEVIRQELEHSSNRQRMHKSSNQIEYDSVDVEEAPKKLSEKKHNEITFFLHNLLERFIKNDDIESFSNIMNVVKDHNLLQDLLKIQHEGFTLLHLACANGRSNFITELLTPNTDLTIVENNDGNTPIHTCVEENQVACLKLLLNNAIRNKSCLEIKNYDGFTAVHLAVEHDSLIMTKILVDNGADLFAIESKTYDTVLHTAVKQNSLEMVKYILKKTGTQLLNKFNGSDKTPLDILYDSEQEFTESKEQIAKCLLDHGGWSIHIHTNEVPHELNDYESDLDDVQGAVDSSSYKNYISAHTLEVLNDLNDERSDDQSDALPSSFRDLSINKTVENPIKFDTQAKNQLCTVLNTSESWRQCAILLGLENLSDIWGRQDNPSECLLSYFEGCNFELQSVIDALVTLDLKDAVSVMDGMVARQLN